MLLRLSEGFGSWLVPGVALTLFAIMFTISTTWIGSATRGDGGDEATPADPHHASLVPEGFVADVSLVDLPPAQSCDFGDRR